MTAWDSAIFTGDVTENRPLYFQDLIADENSSEAETIILDKERFIPQTSLKAKDVISYRLQKGKYILLKVLAIIEEWDGSQYPLFEICDWIGDKPLVDKKEIEALPLLGIHSKLKKFAVIPQGKKDDSLDKVSLIAEDVETIQEPNAPYALLSWEELDHFFERLNKSK